MITPEQMDGFKELPTLELVGMMNRYRVQKEALEEELKGVNEFYDFLRKVAVPEAFENGGIENMKVEGVGRVSLRSDMFVSVPAEKKEQAYEFLRDIGSGDIITETIHSATLKATVKQLLSKGIELPEEFVKVTPYTMAVITKG